MVFSSQTFLFVFLPLLLMFYAVFPRAGRNALLFAASLLFYTWGGGWFLIWLLGSITANWVFGLVAHRARDRNELRLVRATVAVSVVFNIGLLAWFKYANFLVAQVNALLGHAGVDPVGWTNITLPIGISFFTFQASSYVFDIAGGNARVMRNPLDFALFVSLFPHLVAGPILRFRDLDTQIRHRSFTLEGVCVGAVRFAHGLCKKVLIADSVGQLAGVVFASGGPQTSADAWIGILAFTIQIYFDFSAYSDMAIGMGRMFGFRFRENFAHPYASASITEFWRRWHISLSTWFRDYLYIPLGGSRGTVRRTYRNLIVVFLITGFWHGANWTFIVWGAYHGFWLILERVRRRDGALPRHREVAGRARTLFIVMIGWVLFQAATLGDALEFIRTMFSGLPTSVSIDLSLVLSTQAVVALAVGALSFAMPRNWAIGPLLDDGDGRLVAALRSTIVFVGLPIALVLVIAGSYSPFLYFRF